MKQAILSSGGVPATAVCVSGPPSLNRMPKVKIKGISLISNVAYEGEGIRLWRAYAIGPGKLISWKKLQVPQELPHLPGDVDRCRQDFRSVKRGKPPKVENSEEETAVRPEDKTDKQTDALFSCPEEGCVRVFLMNSSLQRHLDCERHKRQPEQETLLDKAAIAYSEKLDGHCVMLPGSAFDSCDVSVTGENHPQVPMGWALKTPSRFTWKQQKKSNRAVYEWRADGE